MRLKAKSCIKKINGILRVSKNKLKKPLYVIRKDASNMREVVYTRKRWRDIIKDYHPEFNHEQIDRIMKVVHKAQILQKFVAKIEKTKSKHRTEAECILYKFMEEIYCMVKAETDVRFKNGGFMSGGQFKVHPGC